MTKLILVRTGKTDWNKINRIQGTCDIPLNEEGKSDAESLSHALSDKKIDAVYSSCLSRSSETASIIVKKQNVKVKKVKELNELNQGVWQGLCIDDVKKRYIKQYSLWKQSPISSKPPEGESMHEAYARTVKALKKIIKKHPNDTVCIVSHEIILALAITYLKKLDLASIWNTAPKIAAWQEIEA